MPITAGSNHAQSLVWESEAWHLAYDYPRNTVESKNNSLKSTEGGSVAAHDRRMLRGVAGQFFLVAMMIAGENVRAFDDFRQHERDAEGAVPEPPPPQPPQPGKRGARPFDLLKEASAPPLAA